MNTKNIMSAIVHSLATGVAFLIPIIILQGYSWESMTLGGLLSIAANWAKLYMSA